MLMAEHGFKIGFNSTVNFTTSKTAPREVLKKTSKENVPKTAFKTVPKEAFNRVPKEVSKEESKTLPHEKRVLWHKHNDELINVSVLLIGTSLVLLYFFK